MKEKNPNYKCTNCGKLFFRYSSTIKNKNAVFCCKKCYYNYLKTSFIGEKNPNYNKKWSEEAKEIQSKLIKEKFIENPELRIKSAVNKGKKLPGTSKKLKEYYKTHEQYLKGKHHSEETKKLIGEKSKEKYTEEYNKRMRKIYEDIGLWIPLEMKDDIQIYYDEANWKKPMFDIIKDKEQIKKLNENGVFNCKKNHNGVVRDHIYSRRSGFENKVFPEILRHPCNCQILTNSENVRKKRYYYHDGDDQTLEELIEKILNYKDEWYEQDLVIKLIEDYKNGKRWINKYRKE